MAIYVIYILNFWKHISTMDTQSHSQYIRNINDSVLHIVFIRKPLNLLLKKEVIFFEQNTVIIGNHRLYALFSDSENTYINKININKEVLIVSVQRGPY